MFYRLVPVRLGMFDLVVTNTHSIPKTTLLSSNDCVWSNNTSIKQDVIVEGSFLLHREDRCLFSDYTDGNLRDAYKLPYCHAQRLMIMQGNLVERRVFTETNKYDDFSWVRGTFFVTDLEFRLATRNVGFSHRNVSQPNVTQPELTRFGLRVPQNQETSFESENFPVSELPCWKPFLPP